MGLLKNDQDMPAGGQTIHTPSGGFNAILDRGSSFEGKLTFEGTVRIDGHFKGEINSDANLVIGESGRVEADVKIGNVSVSGTIRGNIIAKGKVELHPPAQVYGNIETPKLVIEEGVLFEGGCNMKGSSASKGMSSSGKSSSGTTDTSSTSVSASSTSKGAHA